MKKPISIAPGTLSLKTVLSVYFIPIAILPAIFVGFYCMHLYEKGNREALEHRAHSERDAILSLIDNFDAELLSTARLHSGQEAVLDGFRGKKGLSIGGLRGPLHQIRLYDPSGQYLNGRFGLMAERRIPYLSKLGMKRVKERGETIDRYFIEDGFITVVRLLVKRGDRVLGILEEENGFGGADLIAIKNRRGIEVAILDKEYTARAASFALSRDVVGKFVIDALPLKQFGKPGPHSIALGESNYAGFIFSLPSNLSRNPDWGSLCIFMSTAFSDRAFEQVKWAVFSLTIFLVFVTSLVIFLVSNRIVNPLRTLVNGMQRMKTGVVDQIPTVDSTYEVEFLLQSFNEMASKVNAAKRTLEMKLDELRSANQEIRQTQTRLVQSAKMISLGEIVAGVAHELNNPIAFIYSNMHHLQEYVQKVKKLIENFRRLYPQLSEADRKAIEQIERELEIDFVLNDMQDLAKSSLEGANRTKDIVLGLRTFSRTDGSGYAPCDVHEGIKSTLKLLQSEIKGRIHVHEDFGLLPKVECNLSQINQVLVNILSNACQAIRDKGEIWIRTSANEEKVKIEIEDNGTGIPPDIQNKIFDPFFTTKEIGKGTGLGLSIAYNLMQQHGGDITVVSEVGKGSRFTLILPIQRKLSKAS